MRDTGKRRSVKTKTLSDRSPWRRRALGLALLSLLLFFGCDGGEGSPAPDSAATAAAPAPSAGARRVASLSPVATALILELGLTDRILAVDPASGELPGLLHRPRIPDDEDAAFLSLTGVEADLVVLPASRISLSARLNAANIRTVVVLIQDFDDGFTLWGELAGRLGLSTAARDRIAEAARSLAEIAAESNGFSRPRVAAIESFDPLALVGDQQLATALIEIAGGESVTHGRTQGPLALDLEELKALAPELLFHASPKPVAEAERRALAESVAEIAPLVVVEFDPERFFAPETAVAARTLRDAIAPRARNGPAPPEPGSNPNAGVAP